MTFASVDTKDTQRLDGAGASLEVTLVASASGDPLEALARHIAATPSAVPVRWLVLDRATGATTPAVFSRVSKLWTRHRIAGDLGGGVSGDFVDFNRKRPIVAGMQFASFGIDPQVHAFDEVSILETLSIDPIAVVQARRIAGGLPISVAPIRFGAPRSGTPARDDPRQRTNFGGVWALGCLAALASAKPDHASFLLMRISRKIPAMAVLRACASYEGNRVQPIACSDPRRACGFALSGASGTRVLIANFLPENQPVRLAGLPAGKIACTALSGENTVPESVVRIAGGRLTLPGYGIVQLDISKP